ncbi:UDP-N-acetylmuramoyl-L-alanyl-D-glutamate--2,6-diaminopimelate ligase [Sphingorhabdus lutea]|uniref:UDP-N-acetylmuramoyl-L-alanyl-D-glutamate--2,6-diaminopimelate ligase n=1 Tax=Sphingorhabdus lutea TaxID=1913578 RepID=A0A1L3JCW7_9SPHN|nr:UDP-N-acetylmuramoyl-L-alanyl-D-glutamate--2,6-diaminopimelate ligase [Sphingorhabdus lutea]APG62976.1 UDP-N-acetylmuramoyl-L-alanyl-D-glutamate--2,6-diaminopimelate ligase [Sphingorhabdus lutea]
MRLGALLNSAEILVPAHAVTTQILDQRVSGFAIDNRKIAKDNIFGAFRGAKFNGEDFIADAIGAGAIAIVAHPDAKVEGALHIKSDEPRRTFALLAALYFKPFPPMVAAVTGTNGKTSNVELTRQLWRMLGFHAASIGTLGITTADEQVKTGLTTPDIVTFLNNLSGLSREGISHAIFEASSHGLDQYRSEGPKVSIAAFTNFTRDHLDYHGTMEEYFRAKMRLFEQVLDEDGVAVIWADDPSSGKVIDIVKKRGIRMITVGEAGKSIHILKREPTQLGQKLTLEVQGQEAQIMLPLIGAYQAANALTSMAIVLASGAKLDDLIPLLGRLQPVRGRLERAAISRSGAPIYVDYAHTPDALEAAIAALRPHVSGKLHLVFGAGGDRDMGKRKPMGEIAAKFADNIIITDDNPRGEDPASIRAAILEGAPQAANIADRRDAIATAIAAANGNDIILIAGKGHENGQIYGRGDDMTIHPFDDVEVARECAI